MYSHAQARVKTSEKWGQEPRKFPQQIKDLTPNLATKPIKTAPVGPNPRDLSRSVAGRRWLN